MFNSQLKLSIVVIAYNMDRELQRTIDSLSPTYQRDVTGSEYEVIVVDNGSESPLKTDHWVLGPDGRSDIFVALLVMFLPAVR